MAEQCAASMSAPDDLHPGPSASCPSSASLSHLPLPLTAENVAALGISPHGAGFSLAQSTSDETTCTSKTACIETREHLFATGVELVDRAYKLPEALQMHVDEVLYRTRATSSPSARDIVDKQFSARYQDKAGIMASLARLLLFNDNDALPVAITNFSPCTLGAVDPRAAPFGAVVDHCIGYRSSPPEPDHKQQAAFTSEEELILGNQDIYWPFLTAECKSIIEGGDMIEAEYQVQRGGAAIMSSLAMFYRHFNVPYSPVDVSHMSVTYNGDVANIFIHWMEGDTHRGQTLCRYLMKKIYTANLDDLDMVTRYRHILRNHLDWALGPRLDSLRGVIRQVQM